MDELVRALAARSEGGALLSLCSHWEWEYLPREWERDLKRRKEWDGQYCTADLVQLCVKVQQEAGCMRAAVC